jgi:hypothetical protein
MDALRRITPGAPGVTRGAEGGRGGNCRVPEGSICSSSDPASREDPDHDSEPKSDAESESEWTVRSTGLGLRPLDGLPSASSMDLSWGVEVCARDFVAEAPESSGVEAAGDRGGGDGGAEPGSVACWGRTGSKSCRKDGSDADRNVGRRDSWLFDTGGREC